MAAWPFFLLEHSRLVQLFGAIRLLFPFFGFAEERKQTAKNGPGVGAPRAQRS
jgi:hypothetical protein